jgi:type IV pilus assembly protein PilM
MTSIANLLKDPPPEFVFELSDAGIAYLRPGASAQPGFEPLENDVISISPLRDNVLRPEALSAKVRALVGANGNRKRRKAVLILPDFCARVAVLDFDAFPSKPEEQIALVRFRMKKSVPFDVESAAISYHAEQVAGQKGAKRFEVVVVAAALEIVARYEAPFRAAGLHTGIVTTSILATLEMEKSTGISLLAKLSGKVLTVAVVKSGMLKLVRCVELADLSTEEIMAVLFPTVAYVEDEMAVRPDRVLLCGFGSVGEQYGTQWATELGVPFEALRSRLGTPGPYNAGLLGYLETPEAMRV